MSKTSAPQDLLDAFLEAKDPETGQPLPEKKVRDQILTVLIAGYETTAMALFWTLYLLSRHPDMKERLIREVNDVLGERDPGLEDLPRLKFSTMVLEEAMRLYPPVWAIGRETIDEDVIDGFAVPAKSTILLSPYALHRRPQCWEAPDEFKPERFDPEREPALDRRAYIPFGLGARQCIGSEFASLELKLVLPMIVRRFDFQLERASAIRPEALISLRPAGRVWFRLSSRLTRS